MGEKGTGGFGRRYGERDHSTRHMSHDCHDPLQTFAGDGKSIL